MTSKAPSSETPSGVTSYRKSSAASVPVIVVSSEAEIFTTVYEVDVSVDKTELKNLMRSLYIESCEAI